MDPLAAFSAVDTTAMRWIRPTPTENAYELRAGDALLGRMAWRHGGSSLAHVSLASGEIRRSGAASSSPMSPSGMGPGRTSVD